MERKLQSAWSAFRRGFAEARLSEGAKAAAVFVGGLLGVAFAAAYLG